MSEDRHGDEDSATEEVMETVFGELSESFQLNTLIIVKHIFIIDNIYENDVLK